MSASLPRALTGFVVAVAVALPLGALLTLERRFSRWRTDTR